MSFLMYDMNTFDKLSSEPAACCLTGNGNIPAEPCEMNPGVCLALICHITLNCPPILRSSVMALLLKLSEEISVLPFFFSRIENKSETANQSRCCWKRAVIIKALRGFRRTCSPCSDLFLHPARLWRELFPASAFHSLHLMCKEKRHKSPKALISPARWQPESLRR